MREWKIRGKKPKLCFCNLEYENYLCFTQIWLQKSNKCLVTHRAYENNETPSQDPRLLQQNQRIKMRLYMENNQSVSKVLNLTRPWLVMNYNGVCMNRHTNTHMHSYAWTLWFKVYFLFSRFKKLMMILGIFCFCHFFFPLQIAIWWFFQVWSCPFLLLSPFLFLFTGTYFNRNN